ncbi:putative Carboxymuconolactone decarboxylase [metagenome]|uniref:Putative Carboxymuconolactone decarboxylase n=1 Tax=metagenome TaxID=256318 RepID=A0A2P2C483_9ZZZZ
MKKIESREELAEAYQRIFAVVPPSLAVKESTFDAQGLGDAIDAIEATRMAVLEAGPLTPREVQLIQFGMCAAMVYQPGADLHAGAALAQGATEADLLQVTEVAWVVAGALGFNTAFTGVKNATSK